MDAKQVPLRELLASVPADARLVIDDADGKGTRSIPVGRLCQEAAAALVEDALQKFTEVSQEIEAALAEPLTLTDEVIADLWHQNGGFHHHFARAIERWLRGHA